MKERSKFIPLRLSLAERKMLRLVESAMICSDYTSIVDREFKSSTRRMHMQLKGITSIIRGLVIACDAQAGENIGEDSNYGAYENFVRKIFEIARRHKIMNPEKMRTEYGKSHEFILGRVCCPFLLSQHTSFFLRKTYLSYTRCCFSDYTTTFITFL